MTPTLFSVSYAGLWGQDFLGLESFIAKAARLGYPAVELMGKRPHLSPLDMDDGKIKALRDLAAGNGVEIATVAAYTDFTAGKATLEIPAAEMQIFCARELGRLAKMLGAKIVRIFTGYMTGPETAGSDWKQCIRAIRECSAILGDTGVILGVQNHHDTAVSFEGFREFLDEVDHPNCKAMFDPWAPALHGDDLRQCAKIMAPRMVQTTLADYVKIRQFAYMPGLINYRQLPEMVRAVPLGEGFVDLDGFFAGLKDGGFSGYVAYEMCSPLRGGGSGENLDRTAKISLDKIRSLISA